MRLASMSAACAVPDFPLHAHPRLHPAFLPLMSLACAIAVANIYYAQPLLDQLALGFHTSVAGISAVPACTQLGYAAGLIALGPLGDRYPRHRVIMVIGAALVLMLLGAALAPTVPLLAAASLGVGLTASLAQQIIPLVAHLATPERRGRAIGLVMSGLLLGILGGRVVAGMLGQWLGWRMVFGLAAVLNLGSLAMLWRVLPRLPVENAAGGGYLQLVASTVRQFGRHAELRSASLVGALFFASFSVFWVGLTPLLAAPPYDLGPAAAGLFGILGLTGALVAPLSGRRSDRPGGARRVLYLALACVVLSWLVCAGARQSIAWLVLGVVMLDAGVQGSQIANQTRIFALDAAARSRINATYMTLYFLGGAAGTAIAGQAWGFGGWPAVVGAGAGLGVLALLLHALWNPSRR